jgi:uncharacterized membrane protein
MTPDQLEERLGRLLSIGTAISTALLAVGLALWFGLGPQPIVQQILAAGIFVLIATPVGRVVASTIAYAVERDWQMVLMTALVLVSLALSLVVALQK